MRKLTSRVVSSFVAITKWLVSFDPSNGEDERDTEGARELGTAQRDWKTPEKDGTCDQIPELDVSGRLKTRSRFGDH
jgi:hypothetical protein